MNSIQSAVIRFLLKKSDMWNKPVEEIRKTMENIKSKGIAAGVTLTKEVINGVNCEVFSCSEAKKDNAIIYFHGGGFCLGIYDSNREFVANIAKKCSAKIYMIDYRLAPEYPFPAALEDVKAFYKGLLSKGYNPGNLILMGDSSGCALSLSLFLSLENSEDRKIKAMAFITPLFDFTGNSETFALKARKDPFRLDDPLGIAKNYFKGNNAESPLISPLYGEFKGLPAILIHAADYDVFLSDSWRFTHKAKIAGTDVELKVWNKMWHIFHMQSAIVPESRKALDAMCSFIMNKLEAID